MKIALCMECPLLQHGGVETLVRELVKGLHQSHEIFLVSDDLPEDIFGGPFGKFLRGSFRFDPRGDRELQSRLLVSWGKENQIQLFHFHLGGTYGWNSRSWNQCVITQVARNGFVCVSTNHGAFRLFDFVGRQRPLWYQLSALCLCWPAKLRQVKHVKWEATVSKHDWNVVRKWFFPFRRRFRHIYHSILDETTAVILEKENTILCLGTVGSRKGQNFLADAFGIIFRDFPDWKLIIAGRHSDDETSRLLKESVLKSQMGNQVELITDVPDELAKQLLQTSAVFAMPSVAEGLGLSLQEAMFAGAACVGSNVGGIPDMIEQDSTGLLVPPADPEALAAALRSLMADATLRKRLSTNGRRSIPRKKMTRRNMIEKHMQLYCTALDK